MVGFDPVNTPRPFSNITTDAVGMMLLSASLAAAWASFSPRYIEAPSCFHYGMKMAFSSV
jgi:hypothetical protein